MSESQRKKSRRVPVISKDKLDEMPSNSAVGYEREDQWANAFIKKMEQTHQLTVRLPLNLYQKLREAAFRTEDKMTPIIIKAVEEYIKALEKQ
ncbi:MAG: hypothetical protein LBU02_00635 [Rickettsiales bacterium]|jgi:hypothetical protein|nr:hypothetical protein [Rickettsiales bacterium]